MRTGIEEAKLRAALAAIAEIEALGPGRHVIGLGSGSTAKLFVEEVGRRVKGGAEWVGVPTSNGTRKLAADLGVPLLDDSGPFPIEVTVDGADEVSDALDLIKGGGGAHTREKIVNYASKKNVIIVDESKLSRRLGENGPLPVEILEFGHHETAKRLGELGAVVLRATPTDDGNLIADVTTGPIDDPAALDRAIMAIPGVVENGLFVQRADVVIVAGASGVRRLERR
jgi:ribose 5-phosphate isomerase A